MIPTREELQIAINVLEFLGAAITWKTWDRSGEHGSGLAIRSFPSDRDSRSPCCCRNLSLSIFKIGSMPGLPGAGFHPFTSTRRDSFVKRAVSGLSWLLALVLPIVPGYGAESIRLASGEWPPYQSKDLKEGGVAARIVAEAFALEGVTVGFDYFPWQRSYNYAENGNWDGTFIWFDTPERRKAFYISDPVINIQFVLFHRKDMPFDWHRIEDLKDKRIGATLEYDLGEAFQNAEKTGVLTVDRVVADVMNFRKLLAGHIQLVACDLNVGAETLRKSFSPAEAAQITYHLRPVKENPGCVLFSRKIERNRRMVEVFNRGLKKLIRSGRYRQLISETFEGSGFPKPAP